MTIKELSKNAYDELISIRDTMKQAADNSENVAWKFYNQGKADGVNMVFNMMSDVDDDYHDSRDPANVFADFAELKAGQITHTIYVKECDVNAFVGILINNRFRVVIEDIEDKGMWKLNIW